MLVFQQTWITTDTECGTTYNKKCGTRDSKHVVQLTPISKNNNYQTWSITDTKHRSQRNKHQKCDTTDTKYEVQQTLNIRYNRHKNIGYNRQQNMEYNKKQTQGTTNTRRNTTNTRYNVQ